MFRTMVNRTFSHKTEVSFLGTAFLLVLMGSSSNWLRIFPSFLAPLSTITIQQEDDYNEERAQEWRKVYFKASEKLRSEPRSLDLSALEKLREILDSLGNYSSENLLAEYENKQEFLTNEDAAYFRELALVQLCQSGPANAAIVPLLHALLEKKYSLPQTGRLIGSTLNDKIGPSHLKSVEEIMDRIEQSPGIEPYRIFTLYEFRVASLMARVGKVAVPKLRKALTASNAQLREIAAIALGKMGPDAIDSIPELLEVIENVYEHPSLYQISAAAIGLILYGTGDVSVLDRLNQIRDKVTGMYLSFHSRVMRLDHAVTYIEDAIRMITYKNPQDQLLFSL